MKLSLGIFGGTFNPVHTAHLIIAETVRDRLNLDRVLFIPSPRPPHKHNEDMLPFEHRFRMTQLAIAGHESFECSDIENSHTDPSYTVTTLGLLQKRYPAAEFFLIIGADSLVQFSSWHRPDDIIKQATLAVYPREGFNPADAETRFRHRAQIMDIPLISISSSDIRKRIYAGESIRYMVPDAVITYMQENNLYNINQPAHRTTEK
ncbi:nicotinate-nucleotide adenylyltransferase [bacterium]|nr:nicotinate-nucleotide adenylyltransferase [bacterium]